jgi:hypothetical protein
MRTIYAHRKGGRIPVQVIDRWHRAKRSIRSRRARGIPDGRIARALGLDPDTVTRIADLGRIMMTA